MHSNDSNSPSGRESLVNNQVLSTLEARFANQDGIGLLMERLHPEALQWLNHHFGCSKGCRSGRALGLRAPIFDARIDLWWRQWISETQCPRESRTRLGTALFVTGLSIPVLQPSENEEWTIQELEDYLSAYNHMGSHGRNGEMDPEGFSSPWPVKFLQDLIQVCPSLKLTLHSLRRLVEKAEEFDFEIAPEDSLSAMKTLMVNRMMGPEPIDPNDPPAFPSAFWMYLYAGALAGGVLPGNLAHPYPLPDAEPEEE